MPSRFEITEDALTNAIFNNSSLYAKGTGSKLDARIQARRMLVDSSVLDAAFLLAAALEPLKERIDNRVWKNVFGDDLHEDFCIDVMLSVKECRNILNALAKLEDE
jgi:hypothetical protein